MTAMMAMPPVVPVNHRPLRAVTHVIAMIDAEDAFHAADDAAHCCANHRADRASDAVALIEAMRSAAPIAIIQGITGSLANPCFYACRPGII
jgi:hypothetical protein